MRVRSRVLLEWREGGKAAPAPEKTARIPTVAELVERLMRFARGYDSASERGAMKSVTDLASSLYGDVEIGDFGPRQLKATAIAR